MDFTITANYVDVIARTIYPASLRVVNKRIHSILPLNIDESTNGLPFILPGFVDAHVHIESSMLVPSEFARLAVVHGTVATISDPHEIANVCGVEGVQFMIANGKEQPFKFHFGAPSCVPATVFETAGATLGVKEVERLLQSSDIYYLSEVMNYPGVLNGDEELVQKISLSRQMGKPVDGHAPGLRGEAAVRYANAGISTDHECFTKEEALDKLHAGMSIIIREGSAAKNFNALIGLLHDWPERIMFCSDDKHPDNLLTGHINELCARAVDKGLPLFNVLQAACVNPVRHYGMQVGLLQPGDPADFVVVNNLQDFVAMATYIDGVCVAEGGQTHLKSVAAISPINKFDTIAVSSGQLQYPACENLPVIVANDGQLVTGRYDWRPTVQENLVVTDLQGDILKLVVYNRYQPSHPAIAFIKNFGLKKGAMASTVAHDSHNIVAVGTNDGDLVNAINALVSNQGGLVAVNGDDIKILPLPIAGLMTAVDGFEVASAYTKLDEYTKEVLGSTLQSPFMTLSFMALLVIPSLKLSDKGLFDGAAFEFIK